MKALAVSRHKLSLAIGFSTVILASFGQSALAQVQPTTSDDSTVTYPASFFDQYQPYSVNDMLQRIPGISVALGGNGPSGGPGSSGGPGGPHGGLNGGGLNSGGLGGGSLNGGQLAAARRQSRERELSGPLLVRC